MNKTSMAIFILVVAIVAAVALKLVMLNGEESSSNTVLVKASSVNREIDSSTFWDAFKDVREGAKKALPVNDDEYRVPSKLPVTDETEEGAGAHVLAHANKGLRPSIKNCSLDRRLT